MNKKLHKTFIGKVSPAMPALVSVCLLGVLAFITGCTVAPEIKYEADRKVDVSGYKTYALVPFSKTTGIEGGAATPGTSLRYSEPIIRSLKNGLTTKGYTEVTPEAKPDFVVNVRATVVPKTDVTDWGMSYGGYGGWGGGYGYWGHGGYGGYDVSVDEYTEGVLRIEIYDAKIKELVWVGWAKARIDKAPDEAAIAKVTTAILANFPPPPPEPVKS